MPSNSKAGHHISGSSDSLSEPSDKEKKNAKIEKNDCEIKTNQNSTQVKKADLLSQNKKNASKLIRLSHRDFSPIKVKTLLELNKASREIPTEPVPVEVLPLPAESKVRSDLINLL